jgi:hypothetical protein
MAASSSKRSRRARNILSNEVEMEQLLLESCSESEIEECASDSSDFTSSKNDLEFSNSDSEVSSDSSIEQHVDRELPSKKSKNEEWIWNTDSVQISKIPFTGVPGLCRLAELNLGRNPTPYDIYKIIFGDDFFQMIADETNRFAKQKHATKPDDKWFDVSADEIKAFFAICILQSQVKKNTLRSYWSERKSTETPFFRTIMPFKRFEKILSNLHFADNALLDKSDKLFKIRPIINYLKNKFTTYRPNEELSIDESLMKFRGHLSYVQFNKSKRARFGIKIYKICESSSGYCLDFEIYTGKKTETSLPASEGIVYKLMEPYTSDGYTVFLDNWYSSPVLFHNLKNKKVNAVGTVRCMRKNMPPTYRINAKKQKKLKRGDAQILFSHDIAAIRWIDKKPIHMLSTMHSNISMTDTGKNDYKTGNPILKPKAVIDYNRGMGGVDRNDQCLASFPLMRRYSKGYKKIFFYLADMALYNTYALHKNMSNVQRLTYSDYRIGIAESILENITLPPYKRRGRASGGACPLRLQAVQWAHFPRQIPPNPVKQNPSRLCKMCSLLKKKSESRWECEKCLVALHMSECFKKYHTLPKLPGDED